MKTFALDIALRALRWYVTGGVFDRVSALVVSLISEDMPGPDKRETVLAFIKSEYGLLWGGVTNIVTDAIIALTRLQAAKT